MDALIEILLRALAALWNALIDAIASAVNAQWHGNVGGYPAG